MFKEKLSILKSRALNSVAQFSDDKEGATAIMIALLTPLIVAGLAFGSEAASWEMTKRQLQNATDTAAFAAATQLRSGLEESDMKSAALYVVNDSGFTLSNYAEPTQDDPGVTEDYIEVNSPPLIEPYASASNAKNYIHVVTESTVPRRFSKLFLKKDLHIRSEAVAVVQNGRPACVLALDPTADGAVTVSGSADVGLTGCDVAANSISSSAFDQNGNGEIETSCISVVGGTEINKTNNVDLTDAECTEAIENAPVTADPYGDRDFPVDPATLSCSNKSKWNQNNGKPDSGKKYCSGTNVNGTVTIQVDSSNPWIILSGGNWKFNSNADFTAEGVTIYLTDGADLDINGNASFRLKAPTSGDLSGLAVFIDRDETQEYKFNGGADIEIVGAIYGVNAKVTMNGNVESDTSGECNQVIAGRVEFTGNATFDTDCSSSGTTSIKVAESIQIVE